LALLCLGSAGPALPAATAAAAPTDRPVCQCVATCRACSISLHMLPAATCCCAACLLPQYCCQQRLGISLLQHCRQRPVLLCGVERQAWADRQAGAWHHACSGLVCCCCSPFAAAGAAAEPWAAWSGGLVMADDLLDDVPQGLGVAALGEAACSGQREQGVLLATCAACVLIRAGAALVLHCVEWVQLAYGSSSVQSAWLHCDCDTLLPA
jgi:hypothetical protein